MRDKRLGRRAVGGVELDDDVILLAADLEARDLASAQHGFERAADHRDVEPEIGDPVAVDLHVDLRLVELEVGIDVGRGRDSASSRSTMRSP